MDPRPVKVEPSQVGREQLREVIQLDLLVSAQRARRRLSVHVLALAGLPLLVALWWPATRGGWTRLCEQAWAALAVGALLLWLLELRTARRLERALDPAARSSTGRWR